MEGERLIEAPGLFFPWRNTAPLKGSIERCTSCESFFLGGGRFVWEDKHANSVPDKIPRWDSFLRLSCLRVFAVVVSFAPTFFDSLGGGRKEHQSANVSPRWALQADKKPCRRPHPTAAFRGSPVRTSKGVNKRRCLTGRRGRAKRTNSEVKSLINSFPWEVSLCGFPSTYCLPALLLYVHVGTESTRALDDN